MHASTEQEDLQQKSGGVGMYPNAWCREGGEEVEVKGGEGIRTYLRIKSFCPTGNKGDSRGVDLEGG